VHGQDLRVGEELVGDALHQRAVGHLASDDVGDVSEHELTVVVVASQQLVSGSERLPHPLRHDRDDQVVLGSEVAEERAAAHACRVRDLADAHVDAVLAKHRVSRVQHALAVFEERLPSSSVTQFPMPLRRRNGMVDELRLCPYRDRVVIGHALDMPRPQEQHQQHGAGGQRNGSRDEPMW